MEQTRTLPGPCFLRLCSHVSISTRDMSFSLTSGLKKAHCGTIRWSVDVHRHKCCSILQHPQGLLYLFSLLRHGCWEGWWSAQGCRLLREDSGDLSTFWGSPQKQPTVRQNFLRRVLCEAYTYCSNVNSFCSVALFTP